MTVVPTLSPEAVASENKTHSLRVLTYNIHKGVQGVGPAQRLEIHNLQQAIAGLDVDVICLQEVRKLNRWGERRFLNWPLQSQADFLAPHGYQAVYVTNAYTKHGEHGNALLSRLAVLEHYHQDISDHRLEQRGFLHTVLEWQGIQVHTIVVHLGLIGASRIRQVKLLQDYVQRHIPPTAPLLVAGDFNDWNQQLLPLMAEVGLNSIANVPTFPSRMPLLQLDHVYVRGLSRVRQYVPTQVHCDKFAAMWPRLSDHLPLVAEFIWE